MGIIMTYVEQAKPAKAPSQTLIGDASGLVIRLLEISQKVKQLGDQLYGSEPRDTVNQAPQTLEPQPTMRRNLDKMNVLINQLENELTHIEARL